MTSGTLAPHSARTGGTQLLTPFAIPIHLEGKATFEELRRRAGIRNRDRYIARFFWKQAGRDIEQPTVLQGIELHALPLDEGQPTQIMRRRLIEQQLKAATFYELLIALATAREGVDLILDQGSIVMATDGQEPFLVIGREQGSITLTEIDREDHLNAPLFFCGVCFQ